MDVASLLHPLPSKVTGLDLDAELIRQAKNSVRYTWSRRRPTSEWDERIPPPPAILQDQPDNRTTSPTLDKVRTRVQQDLTFFPACFPPLLGSLSFPVPVLPSHPLGASTNSEDVTQPVHHPGFPNNVHFVVGDIMDRTTDPAWRTQGEPFDLVLWYVPLFFFSFGSGVGERAANVPVVYSLSLTKWIQIHHGDQGLLHLLDLFAQLIVPGGLLLLEPHGPSSFKRTKDFPALVQQRIRTLQLKPDQLPALLAQRGFHLLRREQPTPPNHTAPAREVLLFQRQ